MKGNETTTDAPAGAAGNASAAAVQWRCKVTKAGAGKVYGACKHKRGVGAVVVLTDAEAKAAESQGWVTRAGVAEEA